MRVERVYVLSLVASSMKLQNGMALFIGGGCGGGAWLHNDVCVMLGFFVYMFYIYLCSDRKTAPARRTRLYKHIENWYGQALRRVYEIDDFSIANSQARLIKLVHTHTHFCRDIFLTRVCFFFCWFAAGWIWRFLNEVCCVCARCMWCISVRFISGMPMMGSPVTYILYKNEHMMGK